MRSMTLLQVALLIAVPSMAMAGSAPRTLTILATCLETTEGEVRFALFDTPDSHLGKATQAVAVKVDEAPIGKDHTRIASWVIEELPHGDYSLAIYHDENGNGRLDRKIFGLPAEPYGFSNDVRIRFGPPSWKASRFVYNRPGQVFDVCVR